MTSSHRSPSIVLQGSNRATAGGLCANRWREALEAGFAPPVILESTHLNALEFVTMAQLEKDRFQGTMH